MDYLFDVIFGILLELTKQLKPNCKLKKWQEVVLIILSVMLLLCSIGSLIAGVHILSAVHTYKTVGKILLAIGICLILLQCITCFVLIGKHLKEEAAKPQNDDASPPDTEK